MASESKTFYPQAYDAGASSVQGVRNATNPVGKGSTNTSYATIDLVTGSRATTTIYWPFDLSAIPSGAEINSVSCTAKASVSNTSYVSSASVQLYSGSTAKGSSTSILSASASANTLSVGTWTRSELQNCRLCLNAQRGTSSTSTTRSILFYGADLNVTYTDKNEKFMLKLGGSYHDVARVFKKVNGVWIEQTDLANVIPDNVKFLNGGEWVAPVQPAQVTITGTGNAENCYATISGTKYSGSASGIEVLPGDVITFGVVGFSSTTYGRVTIDGTQVLNVTDKSTQTYNWTVPNGAKTINIALEYGSGATKYGRIVVTTS